MNNIITYVDGFNLYHGLKAKFGCAYLWLDLPTLIRRVYPQSNLVALRYFTAWVRKDPDGYVRQQVYVSALKAANGPVMDVRLGKYKERRRFCRRCGAKWQVFEEKRTDVNIAMAMFTSVRISPTSTGRC